MEIRQLNEITINLDNKRKPLNNVQRDMMKTNPKYPYYGANGIVDFIDDYIFDQEILCVAEDGGSWGKNEKCSYIVYDKCWVNNHAHVLVATSSIDIKYLSYYLNQCDLNKYITGTTRGKLTKKALDSILIPLPPLQTQKKIVEILDKAQEIIDGRKEQIKLMDELIQYTFYEMFGDPVTNPKGWDVKKLSDIVSKLSSGKSLAGDRDSYYKVLNTSGVSYKYLDDNKVKNLPYDYTPPREHLINQSDILISRMNTNELVGAAAISKKSYDNIAIPDRIWKVNWKGDCSPIYVWFLLNTRYFRRRVTNIATGTSGSMKNVSQKNYLSLDIPYPPLHLQNQFAKKVEAIEKQKELMEKSLTALENNYNALMQKAFNGELFQE